MPKLRQVEITCTEPGCSTTRLVHLASVNEVKRCWDCQGEHKRRKAKARYQRRRDLALQNDPEKAAKVAFKAQKKKAKQALILDSSRPSTFWSIGERKGEIPAPVERLSVFKTQDEADEFLVKTWEATFGEPIGYLNYSDW